MRKYVYAIGSAALALAMSGLPAIAAHAEDGSEGIASTNIQITKAQTDVRASTSVRVGEQEQEGDIRATSTERAREEVAQNAAEQAREHSQSSLFADLESDTPQVFSAGQLKQSIEQRKNELDDEEASSTPENQDIIKNANPVRLAVHALLVSKDLLGGIGPQVSEIAKHMNDSVATTTNAEVQIQSRGFFTRLLFGGDSAAANIIAQEVAQNQQRIDELTTLLNQSNVSADVQVTLKAQIAALQAAQSRLQDLAQKEQKTWGLFSWRF